MKEKSEQKENFKNRKFITTEVDSNVSLLLQFFMWKCIFEIPQPKNFLQMFKFTLEDRKQKIILAKKMLITKGCIYLYQNEERKLIFLLEQFVQIKTFFRFCKNS